MMRSLYNHILLAVMAFAAVGCLSEVNTDIPSAESGDEVQFGLSLPSMTRTVYGDKNAAGTAYPIYWVDGDKVQVCSPQCLAGRNDAEYKVSVTSKTQNYATSLTPTGVNGVQWGNEPAMFYSVYPSGKYTISEDGATISGLRINFSDDFEVSDDGVVTPKGADCLMFAKTAGKVTPGDVVNLSYSPLATSLMVTLNGPSSESIVEKHTLQSIKLIAPVAIAGKFNVELKNFEVEDGDETVPNPTVQRYVHTGWSAEQGDMTSNVISAQIYDKSTGAFHEISKGEKLSVAMFLAPLDGLTINGEWEIQVQVLSVVPVKDPNDKDKVTYDEQLITFTKKLAFENGFNGDLKPGMVHELPALPPLDVTKEADKEWDTQDWMQNIPRNVYLSEVSIPSSWNSLNEDSQGTSPSIDVQYNLGIRGFHLDTRWKRTRSNGSYRYELGTAVGGENSTVSVDGLKFMNTGATFKENLAEVVSNLKEDEYMLLICSFAADSYNYKSSNGYWYDEISAICGEYPEVYDARNLTDDTVIGDVLNKVIVLVNIDGNPEDYELPQNSKCLFVHLPMTLTETMFNEDMTDLYSSIVSSKETIEATGINMYYTQAQASIQGDTYTASHNRVSADRGGFIPIYGERIKVANTILEWSRSNYAAENYDHSNWIYLGLGGYYVEWKLGGAMGFLGGYNWYEISKPNETLAGDFNTWIHNKVKEMGTIPNEQTGLIPYYPVGIVLMNNVSSYSTVAKDILLLNNKYRMQYDPSKPAFGTGSGVPNSVAQSYASGMNSNNAAFGWN